MMLNARELAMNHLGLPTIGTLLSIKFNDDLIEQWKGYHNQLLERDLWCVITHYKDGKG